VQSAHLMSPSGGYAEEGGEKPIVRVDPRYFRPTEVETLLGDPTKAREKLGWIPKVTFQDLVAEMTREDLNAAKRDQLVKKNGYTVFNRNE
jgi:GDPmannose 4,6-dehydratase